MTNPVGLGLRVNARQQRWCLIAAAIGAAACAVGAIVDVQQLLRSYLFAYLAWLGK